VVDTGVVIAAWEGDEPASQRAIEILADPDREFVVSDILRLELLPQPAFHGYLDKVAFYEEFLHLATVDVQITPERTAGALQIARAAGTHACDALHLEVARSAEAHEFITTERPDGPIFRWTGGPVALISIHPEAEPAHEPAAPA
jgi:predicted nucleic acid-binding protein